MSNKLILRSRPKPYALTKQQLLFKEAMAYCEIKKGISRGDLVNAMRSCIPEFYKRKKEGDRAKEG